MKPLLLGLLLSITAHAQIPSDLKVEHRANPVGVDDANPRFSWRLTADRPGLSQTAWQVLAATSADRLSPENADLWDSGRTNGSETLVRYAGKPLPSSTPVFWCVRTWSGDTASPWSPPQQLITGLIGGSILSPWISFKDDSPFHKTAKKLHLPPARYYRKSFNTGKTITRAIAHASALGIYELHLNGKRIGDTLFAPGWTDYRKRVYYNTYDLTPLLASGENTIGAIVTDGWYAGYVGYGKLVGYGPYKTGRNIYGKTPALTFLLHLTYQDGTTETVTTDGTWKTSTGPELEADFLMGEAYDARKEMPGWAANGFDDSKWQPAIPAEANGSRKHVFVDRFHKTEQEFGFVRPAVTQAYPAQPVRITEELPAKSVTEQAPGVHIFDLAQNFAGIARLKVKAAAGTKITLRFGEMLHPDGSLMTENLREARATDTYICKGDPAGETWAPRFTFHGFRYVELTGLKEKPPLDTITGLVIHSDTPMASTFDCSDPMVTQVYKNAVWTQRANWIELPTDCPQRDERLGWTGDAQIYAASAAIHADVAAFFRKWLRELDEARTPDGLYPSYAPYPFGHGGAVHGTAWSDAGVIVPYALWKATGDETFFTDHWASMNRYMDARKALDPDLKGSHFGAPWGDWLNLDDATPHPYVELAYLALTSRQMAEMADAAGDAEQAAKYRHWLEKIRKNFQKNHLKEDGTIDPGSQTAYVLALDCGLLIDPEPRRKAGEHLAALIRKRSGPENTGITTGFLGTKPLLPVLTTTGHHDLALSLIQSRHYPSWGYEVENGATTIWERWNSFTKEHGFGGPDGKMSASMNSFSHYAFGAVTEWMITDLAGIAPAAPGYSKIRLHPRFPDSRPNSITWVKAHHDSPHGRISVHWQRQEDGSLLYEATVPANTSAELILPESSPWKGKPTSVVARQLQAGTHRFTIP
jgi:alpha-L-rhamnosidase